jgi:hypothetical protein
MTGNDHYSAGLLACVQSCTSYLTFLSFSFFLCKLGIRPNFQGLVRIEWHSTRWCIQSFETMFVLTECLINSIEEDQLAFEETFSKLRLKSTPWGCEGKSRSLGLRRKGSGSCSLAVTCGQSTMSMEMVSGWAWGPALLVFPDPKCTSRILESFCGLG